MVCDTLNTLASSAAFRQPASSNPPQHVKPPHLFSDTQRHLQWNANRWQFRNVCWYDQIGGLRKARTEAFGVAAIATQGQRTI
jgi:hypothetical protein